MADSMQRVETRTPPGALPPDVHLRPATTADRPLRRALFDEVRRDSLPLLDEASVALLLSRQYAARDRQLRRDHPGATDHVVEVAGETVGWMIVRETPGSLQVLDLVLRGDVRGRGIGSAVLHQWFAVADERGLDITLQVSDDSPAARLYERLGFVDVDHPGLDRVMTRPPTVLDAG